MHVFFGEKFKYTVIRTPSNASVLVISPSVPYFFSCNNRCLHIACSSSALLLSTSIATSNVRLSCAFIPFSFFVASAARLRVRLHFFG
jgi:hypothetical protein